MKPIGLLLCVALLLPFAADGRTLVETPYGVYDMGGVVFKTNLLYDATGTVNAGIELRTGGRTSIDIPVSLNVWDFADQRKWRHVLVQPELRLWPRRAFRGSFFGLHGHYSVFNFNRLPKPFSPYYRSHRFEGWLAGAGVSYGHRWNFRNPHWALEATVGVGYAYMDYDVFECGDCGEFITKHTKHYFGPTKAGISLLYAIGSRREAVVPTVVAPLVPVAVRPVVVYEPRIDHSFVVPQTEVKTRSMHGSAYLDFASGRWDIVPGLHGNAAELKIIDDMVAQVKGNPEYTISAITITGYASPEGSYDGNMVLSQRRAGALREYVARGHGLDAGMITANGAGEDWGGLDSLIALSSIAGRERILDITRSADNYDDRESRLVQFSGGAPYRQIRSEIFPKLRRATYRLDYTVAPMPVERARQVLLTSPGDLSLGELFTVANSYEPGSPQFSDVMETAARLYPGSDIANVNAAASALSRKDVATAQRYLAKVRQHDGAYRNNMGVVAWLRGDKAAALRYFELAGATGAANASELRRHMDSLDGNP